MDVLPPLSYHPVANLIPVLETGDLRRTLAGPEAENDFNQVARSHGEKEAALRWSAAPVVLCRLLPCTVERRDSLTCAPAAPPHPLSCHLNRVGNSLVFCVSIKCHMFVLQLFPRAELSRSSVVNQKYAFFSPQSCSLKSVKLQFFFFCSALSIVPLLFAFNFRPRS